MKQAPHADKIVQQCRREGLPIPQAIANAPQLQFGLELYYDAFFELSSCRQMGMAGAGPIPWTAIREYAATYGLSMDQLDDMTYYVRQMDNEFLALHTPKKGGDGLSQHHSRSGSSRKGWSSKPPR